MFSHSKILFLVPLLFVTSIPTYFFNFLIILVCLLFIHAKHSPAILALGLDANIASTLLHLLLRQETIIVEAYRSHIYREAIIIGNSEINTSIEGTKLC